jgi:hypothetical protein
MILQKKPSVEELKNFYKTTLIEDVNKLEDKRKKLKNKLLFIYFIMLWNSIAIYFIFFHNSQNSIDGIFFTIAILVSLGIFIYKYMKKDYRSEFKEYIIKPLIKQIDSNLNYSSNLHISKTIFTDSKLFTYPDKFSGNDFTIGTIEKTQIQFSDIHAQKKYKDSKGKTKYSTIFQGLFIVADFNKNFYGTTIVLPDFAQNSFGDLIGTWLQSKNTSRGELVKMDSVEFEKEFVVYSDDQIEARYILSQNLMELILKFKKKSKNDIYISFTKNKLHIAIDYKKDLFEPTVFTSLLDETLIFEYIEILSLVIGCVEELRLNRRIWSKD